MYTNLCENVLCIQSKKIIMMPFPVLRRQCIFILDLAQSIVAFCAFMQQLPKMPKWQSLKVSYYQISSPSPALLLHYCNPQASIPQEYTHLPPTTESTPPPSRKDSHHNTRIFRTCDKSPCSTRVFPRRVCRIVPCTIRQCQSPRGGERRSIFRGSWRRTHRRVWEGGNRNLRWSCIGRGRIRWGSLWSCRRCRNLV